MTATLLSDSSSHYRDSLLAYDDDENQNEQELLVPDPTITQSTIPLVVVEPTTVTLARKDSIVIPSISNSSISSIIQIQNNENTSASNDALRPICTSNSLGDLSSTPLLLLDRPSPTPPPVMTPSPPSLPLSSSSMQQDDPTMMETTFIQCRSFPSSSSSSSSKSTSSSQSQQTTIIHEPLKSEPEDETEHLLVQAPPPAVKKAPAPPPPPPPPPAIIPSKRSVSQSAGENIYFSSPDSSLRNSSQQQQQQQQRKSFNRQNHQRHGSADLLCRQTSPIHHDYMNRSSTTSSAFYPSTTTTTGVTNRVHYQDYTNNNDLILVEQLEYELRTTKEQLDATMRSIKTFWSPELKKERALRKEESCRQQLLMNEHQKRSKQDAHIQTLEYQLRQMQDELDKHRAHRCEPISMPSISIPIPEQSSIDVNALRQRQQQELKEKLEQRTNEFHIKENECVTLKAKVDTYESKERDLQHYISILKESILIKDQQVVMVQSEIVDLRARLKEKDGIIEKKNSKIQSTRLDRQQRESDLQESKQQLDIRDRKINVLNRKIENLEEQVRDKSSQIASTRAKLTAATSSVASINFNQQTSLTTNTLLSNLEGTLSEKERLIEKLREQKHACDIEHQEDIEQMQRILLDTRQRLEQKEKDYYDGQNHMIELKEQLNNTKSILQRRETHINSLEQQLANTKKTKDDSGDLARLENEHRALQDRLSSYELERIEMIREIEWMQQELQHQQQQAVPPPTTTIDTAEQEQYEAVLNKKQQRIEELEEAVRESLQITTEREYAMTQQRRKIENLEKQIKTLQVEVDHLRTDNNEQSQLLSRVQSELIERKREYERRLDEQIKHLDNAFISLQEKLLGELSEKDSHMADLEMDRSATGASNRAMIIEKLNGEKQQLHNQLKELTEIRTKIIQNHMAAKQEYEQRERAAPYSPGNVDDEIV